MTVQAPPLTGLRKQDGLSASTDRISMGERLRAVRKKQGLTLSDVAARTGLAISTISKVERGRMALAYDRFMQLASGLGLDVGELFGDGGQSFAPGTVCLTRRGESGLHETENYVYRMLGAELRNKRMVPMYGVLKARDRKTFADYVRHPGEEFLYILAGRVTVEFEGMAPMHLEEEDSLYFDSSRGHIYLTAGDEEARILVVCWNPGGPAGDQLPAG
ncbi:helix-turn-helix domain-containing protein [Oceanibacterium hippocampi]|uniref:DNA-binding transcriptional repressor PuuR n=1 Tax=Oceanibacterium hippocampi TaxID=745714 RepID=A0A1Y5TWL2_9PROT|nr:XRE family transcriptional regulator [Oceanibacterium hippocampi]SLN70137.1 DNA-binding transcriptional repressor PuuR [Oceanibacterium hippocampi]